eukprot:403371445
MRYPWLFGGKSGDTIIQAMDISNKNGDIAIGGYSKDLGIVSRENNSFIGLMPSSGFEYIWIKQTSENTSSIKTISFHPTYDYLVVLTDSPIITISIIDVNDGKVLKSAKNIDETKLTNAPAEIFLVPNSHIIYMAICVQGYNPAVAIFNLMDVSSNEISGVYLAGDVISMSTQTMFQGNNNDLYLGGEASIPNKFAVCHSVVKFNMVAQSLSLDWFIVNTDIPSGGQVTKRFAQAPGDTVNLFACSVQGWEIPGHRIRVLRFYLPDMPPERLPTTTSTYPILNLDFYTGGSDDMQCQDLKALTTSQIILTGYDPVPQKTFISVINFKNDDTADYTNKYLQTNTLIGFNSYNIKIVDSTKFYFTGSIWGMPDCAVNLTNSVGVIIKLGSDELCSSFPQTLTTESGVIRHMSSTKFIEIQGLILSYGLWFVEREQVQTMNLVGQNTPKMTINFDEFKINETCDDMSFTYKNTLSNGNNLPSYIEAAPPKIDVGVTSDKNDKGMQTVRIEALLVNGQSDYIEYEIILKSTDVEDAYEIISVPIPDYEYIVGQDKLTITFKEFIAYPDGYPIMYFLALQSGGNYDTSVITFTNATETSRKIEIYTNDNTKKDMKLRVIAKFTQNTEKQEHADFTLKILDQCFRLQITTQPIIDQIYYVEDNSQTVYGNDPSNPWVLSVPACAPLTYSFNYINAVPYSSDLLQISSSSSLMTIFSKSQSDIGQYQVKVTGKPQNGNISASVTFNINIRCKEFKKDPNCQVPVIYTARFINRQDLNIYDEPIRFLPINRIFATASFNETYLGSYTLELKGEIQDIKYNISSSFQFYINIIAANSTGETTEVSQLSIEEVTVNAGQEETYIFPSRAGDEDYIITYQDKIHNGYTDDEFIIPRGKQLLIKPKAIHVATHRVIASTQFFQQKPGGCAKCGGSVKVQQQVNIYVVFDQAQIEQQQKELEEFQDDHKKLIEILQKMAKAGDPPYDKDLSAKIKSITSGGVVIVEFSQQMRVPPNYTTFNESFLEFRVKQDYDRSSLNLKFDWNITDFWDKYMKIQLYFQEPLDVSRYEFDTLAIKFIKNEYFIPMKTYLPISQKYEISKKIPRQMPIADAELLNTIGEVIAQILSGGIMGNSAINYLFQNAIDTMDCMFYYFWFVIVIYITLYLAGIIANQFNKVWDSIYFNMFTRLMIEGCLQFSLCSLLNINNLVFTSKSDAFSSIFSILIILILTSLVYFNFFKVSHEIYNYNFEKKSPNISPKMEKYQNIQYEGGQIDLKKTENVIVQQNDRKFHEKFSSLYNDLKQNDILALQYQSVYIGRRLAVSIIMIFLRDFPNSQIFVMLAQSVANMYYILKIRPFMTHSTNMLELFNEMCITVCLYHMIVFSDLFDDPHVKYKLGWSLTAIVLFQIVMNSIYISYLGISNMWRKIKLRFCRKKQENSVQQKGSDKEQKYLDMQFDKEITNNDKNIKQNKLTKVKKKQQKNFVLDSISRYFSQKKKFKKPLNKSQKQSLNNKDSSSNQNVRDFPVPYSVYNQVNLNSSTLLKDTFQDTNLNSFDLMLTRNDSNIDNNTKDFKNTLKNKSIKRKNLKIQEQMLVQDIFNDDHIINHKQSEPPKIKKNLRRKTIINDNDLKQNMFEEMDGNTKANLTNKYSKFIKKKNYKRKRQSHVDIGHSDLNNNNVNGQDQKNTFNNKNSSDILGDYNNSFLFLDQPMKKFGLRNYNDNINVLETKKELEKQQILNNYDFDNLQFNKF